jgi:hypothetical protein
MKRIITLLTLILLNACGQPALPEKLPPLGFTQSPPFRVAVAQVRVEQHYQPSMVRPNVEQEFATTPAQAIHIWARDRLQAAGTNGMVIVNIDEASVREMVPPRATGISSLFTVDNAQYTANLSANFRLYDGVNAIAVAEATVTATRTRTINRDASLGERDAFYDTLIRDVMRDFDAQATLQLRQYFGAYLR